MPDQLPALKSFYDNLQTVPKLISDLAMGVAEAQRRMDHDYLTNLAEFVKVTASVAQAAPADADQLQALFRAMGPTRYQFTETVVEVRADLQMGSQEELKGGFDIGVKGAVFAVAVNASYMRRSAYDAQASALIRTVLNAVPADPGLIDKFLPRAGEVPHATGPQEPRYQALADAFKELATLLPPPSSPPRG